MPQFQLGAHTFGFAWREDASGAIEQLADAGFTQFEILAMAPHVDLSSNLAALSTRIRRAVEACRGSIVSVDLPQRGESCELFEGRGRLRGRHPSQDYRVQ